MNQVEAEIVRAHNSADDKLAQLDSTSPAYADLSRMITETVEMIELAMVRVALDAQLPVTVELRSEAARQLRGW